MNNKPDAQGIDALLRALGTAEEAPALSALCAKAKTKNERQYIIGHVDDDKLRHALLCGAPKARKNAARLMGALCRGEDEQTLIHALNSEQTRFVRPSIILALGALGGEKAKSALEVMQTPEADDASQEKHVREEKEAIRQALMRLTTTSKHEFTGFDDYRGIKLYCHEGFAPILKRELAQFGISANQRGNNAVICSIKELDTIYKARCFYEALFPLGAGLPEEPQALASKIQEPLIKLLRGAHAGEPPFAYRIECRNTDDRAAYISKLANALNSPELINSTSSYEAELRIEKGKSISAYCKLFTVEDKRFSYRQEALPASIHPAAAASIARLANEAVPNAKSVLDPCCGSGTLLIEYGLLNNEAELTGIDVDARALNFARENMRSAGLKAGLIHLDCTRFEAKKPYDLILANLPFGNRVGTHRDNERLYKAFVDRLPGWLNKGGAALLYTMEYTLLKNCLKAQPALIRDYELRTEAGGLTPYVLEVRC